MGGIEAERAESLAVGEPVLAEQARDDRTAAEAEDVAEGDHHGEHWRGEGDARHHIGVSRMRDEIGVDHVVHQGDQHAEHHGIASEKYASGIGAFSKSSLSISVPWCFVLQSLCRMPFGVHHRHCRGNSVDNGRGSIS